MEVRCMYCRKYFKCLESGNKCAICEREFRIVLAKITKKYDGRLKCLGLRTVN